MKCLKTYINEWKYNNKSDVKTLVNARDELRKIIQQRIKINPKKPYLLDIDTSNITDMHGLFSNIFAVDYEKINGLDNIETLDLSTWSTENVNDMHEMFAEMTNLKKIILKSFDTSKVKTFNAMFYSCKNIESIDLSNFSTENVKDFTDLFCDCVKLKNVDITNFSFNKATKMAEMFFNCQSIEEIRFPYSINTKNVNMLYGLFYNCKSLKRIHNIEKFDTSNVTYMDDIFRECTSLKNLDISKWSVENINTCTNAFFNCDPNIIPSWYDTTTHKLKTTI